MISDVERRSGSGSMHNMQAAGRESARKRESESNESKLAHTSLTDTDVRVG